MGKHDTLARDLKMALAGALAGAIATGDSSNAAILSDAVATVD